MPSNGNGSGNGSDSRQRSNNHLDYYELASYGSFGIGSEAVSEADVFSDKLDLFANLPIEKQMENFRESKIYPVAGLNDTGPYNFHLPAMNSYFLDAGSIRLEGEVAIFERAGDGTEKKLTAANNNLVPINMLPAALFNSIEVSINGLMVSFISSPISNYKAYLETILSYNKLAADTHLAGCRFLMDEPGKFDARTSTASPNAAKRMAWFANSNSVDFSMPLASDILRVDKYFMDRVALDIKLSRAPDEFLITQPADDNKKYFVKIEKLSLSVRHIGLNSTLVESINKSLDSGKRAKYPLIRTVLKTRVIQKGESHTPIVDLFTGKETKLSVCL